MESTIPRMLFDSSRRFGERTAIEDEDVHFTFEELADASLQAARAFMAQGLMPGERVAIWAPNIAEWVVAALGVHCAGGAIVTLNTRLKGSEAAYILRKSGARIVVTQPGFLGTDTVALLADQDLPDLELIVSLRTPPEAAAASPSPSLTWSDFLARGEGVSETAARERAEAVAPDDLADLIFTSGTTGQPKGVMCGHEQNLRAFESWSELVGLEAGDRYLVVSPFFHSMGYKSGWLACLMRGATMIPHAVFDAQAVLERVARDRITVLPGAPTVYQSFLAHPEREKHDLSCLRLAITGAATIPVELIHRMRDELGFETIITGYGLTESCGIVTMCRFDDDPETIATTSGRAIPDLEVRCIDPDGQEVERGQPGELVVRGYTIMQGYYSDSEETNRAIDAEGWLHTGDIAVMDARGYVRITDRIKDMFIVGGFNCYPAEIENALYGTGRFEQVAVIGIPDERMGEVGMAFVVPAPNETIEPDEVIAYCRENMANYKVPRRVEVVDALPMNATGKVQKFLLRERAPS